MPIAGLCSLIRCFRQQKYKTLSNNIFTRIRAFAGFHFFVSYDRYRNVCSKKLIFR